MAVQQLCRKDKNTFKAYAYLFTVPPLPRNADKLPRVLQKSGVKTDSRSMGKGWKNLICLVFGGGK